ncbi:phage tail tape measure protein [Acutalibacter muris]|uniref:phage tail tape measure protein n=1 Tax=Acutalibacter muris TaxID=1796620 RepID=UPI001C3EB50C|nr:phage tail tape measure protein [Acutalibacter muris]
MAGRKEFELLFKLQATLGSGFNSSFNSAMNASKQLQGNLSKINTLSGKIEGFQKQSAALQANKDKLAELTAEHDRLQREMSQTEQPSEALRQKMERNARQIEQTTARIEEQEARLGELGNELRDAGVDTDHLTEENERLADSYERVKKNQEKLASIAQAQQKNNEAISKTKTQLAGTLGTFAAVGAAIYAGPVQKSIEFQTAMAKVGTIADQNVVPLSQMQKEIINLSNALGVNANAVAEDVYNAISAGQNTADAVGFVEKATMLAKGGFAETGQALDVLTTILNAYGKESSEAETVSNMLIMTQNRGKVTVAELSSVMGKIIPTANANNVALEQLCAGYSIMTARGIAAAETTTYMNSMLNELGKSGTTADKVLRQAAGGSFSELMAQGNSLADVLNILQTEADKSGKTLADMFGSAEAGKAALTLMANGVEGFNDEVSAMVDSTGAAQSAYEKMMDTTEAKIEKAKTALSNLGIVLGNTFLPYVTTAAEKLSGLVTKFSEWAQNNPELLSTIVKVAAALAGLKVGALAGKLGFLEIKGGILAVQGAFTKLKAFAGAGGGIKSLFSGLGGIGGKLLPIVGIIGGVALAIKLISGNLEEVRGWIQQTFGDGALAVFDKVWGVIQNVGAAISGIFSGENMGNARNFFQEHFGDAGVAVFDSIIGVVEQLKGILPGLLDQFAQLATSLLPVIGSLIQQIVPLIGEIIATVLPVLFDLIAQLLPVIGQIVEAILPVLIQLVETLVPIIMQIIEAVLPILQQLLEALMPIIQQIIDGILPVVIDLIMMVVSAIMPLVEMILPVLQSLLEALMPIIQLVAEMFSNYLAAAITAVSGILDGLTQILSGLITFITGVFTGNWTQAWQGIKSIFSGVWESIKSICTGVVNGIISVINTLIGGLNKLKIPDWVPGIGGKGINIPLIPMLAKGSKYTPDTFIAGEAGAELVTNARGRTVFTAAQTGRIFDNINAAREAQDATTVVTMLPLLQAALSAARVGAGGVSAPSVTAAEPRGAGIVIHSAPVFNVGSDAQAEDIEAILNERDERLLNEFDDRMKQQEEDERRRNYD